jgi:hypothetical protein
MADITTIGSILIDEALPEKMRGKELILDKKNIHKLFQELAEEHPDRYKEVLNALSEVGKTAAWTEGVSVSLAALRKSSAKEIVLQPVREKIRGIINDDSLDSNQRKDAIVSLLVSSVSPLQKAIVEEARAEDSPFAKHVDSGARGKASDLSSLRGADLLATDSENKLVSVPLLNSYAEGFTPAQYFAASYGQRRGQLDVKLSTADSGFLSKQLSNAVQRQVVTREQPDPTRLPVGFPVSVSDHENIGAVLALDSGKYKAGTIITPEMLEDLKDENIDDILIHSPLTEVSEDGGISALAAGRRTRRGLHRIGDNVGLPAAQAIGERLSQGALSCLAEGTMVRMADYSSKPIEEIQVGDKVLGSDYYGRSSPVMVTNVFYNGVQDCVRSKFIDGKDIWLISTTNHKVLAYSKVFQDNPYQLEVGGLIHEDASAIRVLYSGSVERVVLAEQIPYGMHHVYDIEVDNVSHLFVLHNGLVVSNSKHTAGVQTRLSRSGFEFINRLIQSPEHFPEAGPLAEVDGAISDIHPAPQGGNYIKMGDKTYYAGPDTEVIVKVGQQVEQGDDLTDGVPHPADLVRLRGLGEARRVYLKHLKGALDDSGVPTHRRNAENVVAGLLNWVRVTTPDGIGDNIYDDIVPYNRLAYNYKPRPTAKENDVKSAIGQYLEEPALHYTPGTRITKRVAQELEKWKIGKVFTNQDPPDFEPYMVRGMLSASNDPDWRTRLGGFYTARSFQKSLHRGLESDTMSTSFVPSLTQPKNFGRRLETLGKYGKEQ